MHESSKDKLSSLQCNPSLVLSEGRLEAFWRPKSMRWGTRWRKLGKGRSGAYLPRIDDLGEHCGGLALLPRLGQPLLPARRTCAAARSSSSSAAAAAGADGVGYAVCSRGHFGNRRQLSDAGRGLLLHRVIVVMMMMPAFKPMFLSSW